jgi:signal transduction histidine kinase
MLGKARTARFAIVGFIAVALLVLSGLTWATVASLRLERATQEAQAALREAQAQTDLRKSLEIARLRMDGMIWPALVHEASRPYWEYAAYYYTSSEDGTAADAELVESPLHTEGTEPWISLYFQVTEELCWTSPQLSPCRRRVEERSAVPGSTRTPDDKLRPGHLTCTCVEADASDPVAVERKGLLDRLARAYTPDDLAERLAAVWNASTNDPAGGVEESSLFEIGEDSYWRQSRAARLQQAFLPPLRECESQRQVLKVTGREVAVPAEELEKEYFRVRVNKMTAIGLPLPGDAVLQLALVRRVDIGSDRVFQGLVVDLEQLTETLAPRVRDLFDHVQLELVLTSSDSGEAATRLGSLPVRLVVPEARATGHPAANASWVRITVAIAWGTAVIALAAIGLGVKRLVSLTERRKEFTYAVTHELRTPLTTFQLYTDMLAAGLVPEGKKSFYLDTLNRESRRLAELVTEVLEFSRVENDAVHAQLHDHRISELLEAVRERYASRCANAGMTLAIEMNGTGDRAVHTDSHLVMQILGTLIDNACKYASVPDRAARPPGTGEGRLPPAVQLRVIDTGNRLAVEVADTGPGIAPQDRADLFKPFRRGSQEVVSRTGGVGLGLALAKRWTRLLHGDLALIDRPDEGGACFRLTLPAAAP